MIDVDWELLFRYLGGECTPSERTEFERWLAADPEHLALLESAALAGERVLAAGSAVGRGTPASRRTAPARPMAFLAAAVLAVVLGGVVALRVAALRKASGIVQYDVARTGRGQRGTLRLSDGTRVILGPSSTLRHPSRFGEQARDVELTGEAYFEVVHDARRPFRVHAGGATAEDLGTAFGVRAFPDDSVVRVVVAKGMVSLTRTDSGAALRPQRRGTVLRAGELGQLAAGGAIPSVEQVDVDAYLGWMRGELAFDDTPLAEAMAQLGRTYDREVRIGDGSLARRRVTGRFRGEPLSAVLAALEQTLGVRFERDGDTIVVRRAEGQR